MAVAASDLNICQAESGIENCVCCYRDVSKVEFFREGGIYLNINVSRF